MVQIYIKCNWLNVWVFFDSLKLDTSTYVYVICYLFLVFLKYYCIVKQNVITVY